MDGGRRRGGTDAGNRAGADGGAGGRRAVLIAGATAAFGAVGVVSAGGAEAAARPVYLGLNNDARNRSTTIRVASTASGFRVYQTGTGHGAYLEATRANGLGSSTGSSRHHGVHARNTSNMRGAGGAVRASIAATRAQVTPRPVKNVPAVKATGGAGAGVALLAEGESYLDGDALALRSWVGVLDDRGRLAYAPLVSGEQACHTAHGLVVLDAEGTREVSLGAAFVAAADLSTLAVSLTPRGKAMPDLWADPTSSGFVVGGGRPWGRVFWMAFADRYVLDLGSGVAAAGVPAPAAGPAAGGQQGAVPAVTVTTVGEVAAGRLSRRAMG